MPDLNLPLMELLSQSFLYWMILLGTIGILAWLGRCVPTQRALVLLVVPVPLYFLGFYLSEALPVLDLYTLFFCLVCLVDRFLLTVPVAQIELNRHLEKKLSINQNNPVLLTVVNNSQSPVHLELVDEVPLSLLSRENAIRILQNPLKLTVPAMAEGRAEYLLCPMVRGQFEFGPIAMRYRSRLGLLWRLKKGGRGQSVKVYPDLSRLKAMSVQYSTSQRSGEVRRKSLGVEGTQFAGLRTYAVGDDVRKMDWRATARLDAPVVRTFSSEVEQPILLLLDAGRKMQSRVGALSKLDWAMNAAFAFAGVALNRGDMVGCTVFHQEIAAQIPMGTGKNHLWLMLEKLYAIQPQSIEPDYERMLLHCAHHLRRRSLVILFTDVIDSMASRNLMNGLKLLAAHHLVILVTLADQELVQIREASPTTIHDAYEKGVATDLWQLRRQSLQEMHKSQLATVVDAPPEKLDEALINQYLQLKLRSRL